MILDFLLQFSGLVPASGIGNADGTDSPTTGTQTSSNIIDLHMAGIPVLANLQGARDMGIGDQPALKLLAVVTSGFTGGTSMQINLQGATDNGSGAPAAFTTWWSSPVYALATLVTGARLFDMDMPRPPDGVAVPRFLQFQYISVGTFTRTGSPLSTALRVDMVLDRHDQMYQGTVNSTLGGYPPGIAIAN
jgi:hypothetical protein